jgi:hypothetical protein
VKPSAASRRKRTALETAARERREAQGSDRDEILAARRALRQAEKFYDRAVARAERDLNIARAPSPIAAYGSRLILYDDRLSTPARTFALVASVRAEVTNRTGDPSSVDLVVDGPDWRELVTGPKRDEQILRQLAGAVDQAAQQVDAVSTGASRRRGSPRAGSRRPGSSAWGSRRRSPCSIGSPSSTRRARACSTWRPVSPLAMRACSC